jgi:hypothetical protein
MARRRRQVTRAEQWGVLVAVVASGLGGGVVMDYGRTHQWSMARQLLVTGVVVAVAAALVSGVLHWNRRD